MRLVEIASSRFGPPSILITDQGSQFRAGPFQELVRGFGIEPLFGAVGQSGSIAIIERFWRTLKDELQLETVRSLVKSDLDERLRLGLIHYAVLRPHQSLEGATPIEAFLAARAPPSANVEQPPRSRPGEGPAVCPFAIRFLDKEKRLPYLIRNAA